MSEIVHPEGCSCGAHDEEKNGISRRAMLRSLGALGAGLTLGPTVAMGALNDRRDELVKSKAVLQGKAQKFTILHTSDIHAQLNTHDEFFLEGGNPVYKKRGGFGVLKTMIDTLRNEDPENTIVIDGGDCFQGGGVAAMSEGRALVPLMDRVGYDLVLPGNWEVIYGKEMMLKDLGSYKADKVCANMFHAAYPEGSISTPDKNAEFKGEMIFPPYWTKRVAGVKIGFIGYNDPLTPKRQSPAYSYGIQFTKPELNVAKYIRILRDYEQCAMVFLVTHMGLAQQVDLANKPEVEGADLILGADTHERVRKPIDGKYSKVTEPGAFGSFVARLDVVVEDGKVKDSHYELLDVDPEKYPADQGMLKLVDEVSAPYKEQLSKVVGSTKNTLVRYYVIENPMDNLITDAIMWKLKPEVAISNGFRFCPPIVADGKTPTPITNDNIWSMIPVDSEAKYGEATGQQLWDWLEKELHNVFAKDPAKRFGGWVVRFKGMTANFTMNNDMGKRVNWIKVGKKPIDLKRTYVIAACEREGDPNDTLCRLEKVSNPRRANATMHNILREYFGAFSPVAPKVEGRITATDAPQTLLSQLEGYDYEFR
ncbi:MAG: 5'-nucleotidase C-terminal domain-containing protein [Flavobacteriales bacterium]|nr:5'-nucleotidase C-terminal domain-containing protein [Flavobacteriales bacterium]MBP6698783.1 5'-nucleotidase C-terminal domain-containing protein [Flavobacteriales bacterium]